MPNSMAEVAPLGLDKPDPSGGCCSPVDFMAGIVDRRQFGMPVLSPQDGPTRRRILYVNGNGGEQCLEKIRNGLWAPHHLWGCLELVRMGYEVALAEPLPYFYLFRNSLPHDLRLLRPVREWLGRDGLIYSGHTLLYWLPLLRKLGLVRARVVSLCFAREQLDCAWAHDGIIALTPAAADQARSAAPRAKVAHLAWGADQRVFPHLESDSQWFLSCGLTNRDHQTLGAAAIRNHQRIRLVVPRAPVGVILPASVEVVTGGLDDQSLTYARFLRQHYAGCIASLIITSRDDDDKTANGFTNLIESMFMARPVIMTRTGALRGEIDIEQEGFGLYVPAGDPEALAAAMESLARDPELARTMGQRARQVAEERYDITRFAARLHLFFETL